MLAMLGAILLVIPPSFLPRDATTRVSCVPALGDIYYNPKKLPFGPTFGVFEGEPVFQEVMISQRDFARGKTWNDIAVPIKDYNIDHVDIWYVPRGHEGAPFPHYDIVFAYMPHARHMQICNPSGKLPDFVRPPSK